MHIPENYLSPTTCAVLVAGMVPVWLHAVKKVNSELPKDKIPFLGLGAAFSFLGMMFNVPLLGGTTGHAVGGTLLAVWFGPDAACIALSVALLLQAVVFGDGGVLAWGANCFNMAFILPYAGYAVYSFLVRGGNIQGRRFFAAAAIASYIGINLAALCAGVEFGLQPLLFRDEAGRALYCPYDLRVSVPAMVLSHLTVAGLVEAVFTVAVLAFLKKTTPDLAMGNNCTGGKGTAVPVLALLAVLIGLSPLGLLASGTAWGEWAAGEIAFVVVNESPLGYIPKGMAEGWNLSVLMPDYAWEGVNEVAAYILAAVMGTALLIIIFKLLGLYMKGRR